MPRPRKVSDEEVFAAAHRAMARLGPGELTLAAIAGEAGVTAAALVQRFGSKRALLLGLAGRAAAGAGGFVAGLARRHRSPLAALRAYARCQAGLAASPAALARSLAYLQIDLTDAEFRRHLLAQARATRAGLRRLVAAAVEAGELDARADAGALARAVETALGGSLLTWAVYRQGDAARWLVRDLDAVLLPWRARPHRRSSTSTGRSRSRS